MREVIPNKLIVSTTEAGVVSGVILQYKLRIDGVMNKNFYTINVINGIDVEVLQGVVDDAIAQATSSENPT